MRTTLHHQDGPIRSAVSDHSDFCVLSFQQGGDIVHIHLPKRMEAASHMIVEAFNAHMNPEPRVIAVQTGDPVDAVSVGFPSGGALSAEGAMAVVVANADVHGGLGPNTYGEVFSRQVTTIARISHPGDGHGTIFINADGTTTMVDDHAAHVVERRDLP